MSDNTDPRLSRAHIIHAARVAQIGLNLQAVAGGRPYIAARLSRLPFEVPVEAFNHRRRDSVL